YMSLWSPAKEAKPRPSCFICEVHLIRCARALALERAGRSKLARIAMIAITTSNSIKVNAIRVGQGSLRGLMDCGLLFMARNFLSRSQVNLKVLIDGEFFAGRRGWNAAQVASGN